MCAVAGAYAVTACVAEGALQRQAGCSVSSRCMLPWMRNAAVLTCVVWGNPAKTALRALPAAGRLALTASAAVWAVLLAAGRTRRWPLTRTGMREPAAAGMMWLWRLIAQVSMCID